LTSTIGAVPGALLAGFAALGLIRRRAWARAALFGSLVPLAGVTLIALLFVLRPGPADRLKDVTTDVANPPSILVGPNTGRLFPPEFVKSHRDVYPDIMKQVFEIEPVRVFAAVLQAARERHDWEILHRDEGGGDLQLVTRTSLFRFEDDLVVRVRSSAAGSVVDMRQLPTFRFQAEKLRLRTFKPSAPARPCDRNYASGRRDSLALG
jgi:Protein of unknown function (DUF1499)